MISDKIFERTLHLWDKWLSSIEAGRQELHQGCSLSKMKATAKEALNDLEFPSCLALELYWLCCVFTQYRVGKTRQFNFNRIVVPDWFPLPFGFAFESVTALRGKRIYPPPVWDQADVDFHAKGIPTEGLIFPPSDFVIVLPAQHPVRQFVERGRPSKTDSHGVTWL